MGKKRGRPRLKYFDQIIGDMGCETFREVKELAWEPSGDGWLHQTSLRTVYSMMMMDHLYVRLLTALSGAILFNL